MARIRTVKPSFWGDEKVAELSYPARLLMLGLISMADDEGRFIASHHSIAGYVYPNDQDITPARLNKWLAEITRQGMVVLYNGGRSKYGVIPNYTKHQKINRPSPSTLPAPPPDKLFD